MTQELHPFGEGIWIAEGPPITAAAGFHYPTRMAILRLRDGGLFVWSPIRLSAELRAQTAELGAVERLVAPNRLHHMFLSEWVAAWPEAKLYGAPGLSRKRPDLAFDAELGEAPEAAWAEEVDQAVLRGNLIATEVVFFHRPSRTALFTDLLQQLEPGWFSGWRAVVAKLDLMTEAEPAVPRKFRLAFTDRRAARQGLERIFSWPVEKVVMAHGEPVRQEGAAFLRRAFAWLD